MGAGSGWTRGWSRCGRRGRRRSGARGPAGDAFGDDAQQRTFFERHLGVLGVAGAEGGDGGGGLLCVPGLGPPDFGGAAQEQPPELGPVVVVVVEQEGGAGVFLDVAEASEAEGLLGFFVDRDPDGVVVEREDDGHQVRIGVVGGGGQMGTAAGVEQVADIVERRLRSRRHGGAYQLGRPGSPP